MTRFQLDTRELREIVAAELLTHGEFSTGGTGYPNAVLAADAVIAIVRSFPVAVAPGISGGTDARNAWSTLWGQIASIYEGLDPEDSAWVDREWAKQRGYILPTGGTSTLAALPSEAIGREWQPIETAPRDGTPIDLFSHSNHRWCNYRWDTEIRSGMWSKASCAGLPWEDRPSVPDENMTHWMPLPAGPMVSRPNGNTP